MIRQANKFDKLFIVEIMREFCAESDIVEFREMNNPEYWDDMLNQIFAGKGIIYIDDGKGIIIGMIAPNIWDNKTYILHELAWYVRPQYRNSTTGYRLLQEYLKFGRQLKNEKRILFFTLSKLDKTPNINYSKLGFRKLDENWVQ